MLKEDGGVQLFFFCRPLWFYWEVVCLLKKTTHSSCQK